MTRGVKIDPKWTLEERTHIRQWVAQGLTAPQIAEKVGRKATTVRAFVLLNNLGPWVRKHETKNPPEGFADLWRTMSQSQLSDHYNRASSVIQTWCKQLGLKRPTGVHLSRGPKVAKPAKRPSHVVSYHRAAPIPIVRDNSEAGLAAQYLQRFGSVYRCTETGRADQQGTHWRRGCAVLTAEEIIERAIYNGYQARQAA